MSKATDVLYFSFLQLFRGSVTVLQTTYQSQDQDEQLQQAKELAKSQTSTSAARNEQVC